MPVCWVCTQNKGNVGDETMSSVRLTTWMALTLHYTCAPLRGQTTFVTTTGTVLDRSGSAVPRAVVTVTNIETNQKNAAESNESGTYTIPQLRDGSYILEAKAAGFQDFAVEKI